MAVLGPVIDFVVAAQGGIAQRINPSGRLPLQAEWFILSSTLSTQYNPLRSVNVGV